MNEIEQLRANITKLQEVALLFDASEEGFWVLEKKINEMVAQLATLEDPHREAKQALNHWIDKSNPVKKFMITVTGAEAHAVGQYVKYLEEQLSNRPIVWAAECKESGELETDALGDAFLFARKERVYIGSNPVPYTGKK